LEEVVKSAWLWIERVVGKGGSMLARRGRRLALLLLVPLVLGGCVDYDVGIEFDSQTHGTIVQQIELGERLSAFSGATAQSWLQSIERRSRQLGGKSRRLNDREVRVEIPFNNGDELVRKFNEFFNSESTSGTPERLENAELPQLESHMAIVQRNFLLAIHNRLSYDLDLRSLGLSSQEGKLLVGPGALLDLHFRLTTPWGAKVSAPEGAIAPEMTDDGRQVVWTLQPGEANHLEATFWVPSPIGIGALAIAALVALGHFVKYRLFPALGFDRRRRPTSQPAKPEAETAVNG
jgi:hypothetical protein